MVSPTPDVNCPADAGKSFAQEAQIYRSILGAPLYQIDMTPALFGAITSQYDVNANDARGDGVTGKEFA